MYIKKIYINNKLLFSNFTYLWILQFVRIIIPIILIPILINNLGLDRYGMIIFSQTVIAYLMMVLNFGFEMSATKQISIHRNNPDKISEIVSAVLIIQLLFFLIIGVIYFFILKFIFFNNPYFLLFCFSFLFILQELFLPIWYFQGLEKMKFITIIDVISRVISFVFIILFINNSEDYLLVPIFRFIGVIIAGTISIYIIFIQDKIKLKFISLKRIYSYLKESSFFFISKFSNIINEKTNLLLLGLFVGMSSVTFYDFANKVISAINLIFGTLVKVLYPHIAVSKDKLKVKKILYISVIISVFSYLIICIFSKSIILIMLGEEFLSMYYLFYYFAVSIPLVSIGWIIGDLLLAAFGYSKDYSLSSIIGTIFYLLIISNLFFFNLITLYSLIMALIGRLVLLDIYRFYCCKKYNLI